VRLKKRRWRREYAEHENTEVYRTLRIGDFVEILRQLRPSVRMVDDCVTLAIDERDAERFSWWLAECKGDRTEAERHANHVHLSDLLDGVEGADALSSNDWMVVLDTYVALLRLAVERTVGNSGFEVTVFGQEDIGRDPHDCEITFCLRRCGG